MPIYEADPIGRALFKYLIVGVTCFAIGYIRGCEHGKTMNAPSRIETKVQSELSKKPLLAIESEENVIRPNYAGN